MPDLCTVSGILYKPTGELATSTTLRILRARKGGVVLSSQTVSKVSDAATAEIEFTAVQGSLITLQGDFLLNNYNISNGLEFFIRLEATASLESLLSAADYLDSLLETTGFAPNDSKYVLLQADADLGNSFSLGTLTTGILKNTVTGSTGALTAAVAADLPSGIDALKIGGGAVSNTEFSYLDGVTSAIQTQIDNKVSFDINSQTEESTIAGGDFVAIYDVSASALRKMTRSNFVSGLSASFTVREVDGSPSLSATTVEFAQANGLVVTDQGSGVGRISLASIPDSVLATISTAGKVSDSALSANVPLINAANVFTSSTGQSLKKLLLPGSTSGTLTVQSAATAGTNTITLPAGTTDFSATGGSNQFVRQNSAGGAFTVSVIATGDLPTGIDAANIADGSVSNAEFQRLDGVTSAIQTQFSGKASTALSNLASVSINASLIPQTTLDLGAAATAWRDLYLYGSGTFGSHSFRFTGTPTGNRVLTLPDSTATFATLSNKLSAFASTTSAELASVISDETGSGGLVFGTSPTVTGATLSAVSSFGIRSSGTGAFDLTLANTENLTAARTLTLTLNDAARTVNLGGNLTTAAAFITSGANSLTLTTTGSTNVTLPTTGTIVARDSVDTLTNKTYDTGGTGNSFSIAGVAVTANTGTGAVARATSPSFTTPTLGTATATQITSTTIFSGTSSVPAGFAGLALNAVQSTNGNGGLGIQNSSNGASAGSKIILYNDRGSAVNQGQIAVYSSGNTQTTFGLASLADWFLFFANGGNNAGMAVGTASNAPFFIATNNTERLRFDASGNMLFGTQTAGTTAAGVFALSNGATNPTTRGTDIVQIWAKDTAAGDARLRIASESGAPIIVGNDEISMGTGGSNPNTATQDAFLGRSAAANWRFGDVDAASPVAQKLSVQGARGGTDTDTAGASPFTLVGSLGTGTGVPGRIHLQTGALSPTSGTTAHTAVDRVIAGASKVLTNNTTTTVTNITAASNTVAGGVLDYSVEVFNGTDLQVEEGSISYHVTNKGGTIANNTTVKFGNQQATTSGTLTVTWTITAANPALLQINANSSLTPSSGYPRVTYHLRNLTQQAVAVQ